MGTQIIKTGKGSKEEAVKLLLLFQTLQTLLI